MCAYQTESDSAFLPGHMGVVKWRMQDTPRKRHPVYPEVKFVLNEGCRSPGSVAQIDPYHLAILCVPREAYRCEHERNAYVGEQN